MNQASHASCGKVRASHGAFKKSVSRKKDFFLFHVIAAAALGMSRSGYQLEMHARKVQLRAVLQIIIRRHGFRAAGLIGDVFRSVLADLLFLFICIDRRAGKPAQFICAPDMVKVAVGQEDSSHLQTFAFQRFIDLTALIRRINEDHFLLIFRGNKIAVRLAHAQHHAPNF